jgi:hypothetical protein
MRGKIGLGHRRLKGFRTSDSATIARAAEGGAKKFNERV